MVSLQARLSINRGFSVTTNASPGQDIPISITRDDFSNQNSCIGCGSNLQSENQVLDGYIPKSTIERFSDGWRRYLVGIRGKLVSDSPNHTESTSGHILRQRVVRVYCQRCFRLQQYGRTESPEVFRSPSIMHSRRHTIDESLSSIPRRSLVLHVIDVLNFEDSLLSEMYEKLHRMDVDVISIINKIDCLPSQGGLDRRPLLQWAMKFAKVLRRNVGPDGKLNLVAVSSASGEGMQFLENRMAKCISGNDQKDIFVVGSVNSGKSTFCNRFLKHVGYRHLGHVQYQRGVGGVTRSAIPGTTRNHLSFRLSKNIAFFDTPGISLSGSMYSHMSCSDDFRSLCNGTTLQPPVFTLKADKELLLGAMARLKLESGNSVQISPFISPKVTLHICGASNASEFLQRKAGTFLYPPFMHSTGTETEIIEKSHSILSHEWTTHRVRVFCSPSRSHDDIVISGLGWVSLYGHGHKILQITVPGGVRVFRRPSILPNFIQQHGSCKFAFRSRGRSLRVSKYKRRITRQGRGRNLKETWREDNRQNEELHRPERDGSPCHELISADSEGAYIMS